MVFVWSGKRASLETYRLTKEEEGMRESVVVVGSRCLQMRRRGGDLVFATCWSAMNGDDGGANGEVEIKGICHVSSCCINSQYQLPLDGSYAMNSMLINDSGICTF